VEANYADMIKMIEAAENSLVANSVSPPGHPRARPHRVFLDR